MKKFLLGIMTVLFFSLSTQAQNYTTTADNDPAAKAVLDKIKTRYNSFKTVSANFSLDIEIPQMETEIQKGRLWQEGEKYRAELDNRSIISNGETVWVYLGNNKEVQINCASDFAGEGMMSPKDLLNIYEQEEYVYYLANEFREGSKTIQQIEFKPTDRDSEYSKLRLTLDKKTLDVVRMKIFAKDGSRFTLKMDNWVANESISADTFTWKESECSDCYVEDLRDCD